MFEHYLHNKGGDPARRRRIAVAANLSASVTAGFLMFTWLADKLQIARVDAPTVEYVLFQLTESSHVASPPPPPPPLGTPEADKERERPIERPVEDVPLEDAPPELVPERVPTAPPSRTVGVPDGKPEGKPWGVPRGIPNGVGLGLGNGTSVPPLVGTQQSPPKQAAPEPFDAAMSRCVYCPSPDTAKLSATTTGMFNRRSGVNKTRFCIGVDGKVDEVTTASKFPGDPRVDAICRDTIKRWRFKPFKVADKARRSCTTATFNIQFER
ncbi:MAG: hypothetical protein R3A51_19765 [Nannocystaceae bacterium]|nr:hypothetical protein [Myxococcales bacterium]